MPIAYIKHPIERDEVIKIREQGFTTVDIRFKPEKLEEGDKDFTEKPKPKRKAKAKE